MDQDADRTSGRPNRITHMLPDTTEAASSSIEPLCRSPREAGTEPGKSGRRRGTLTESDRRSGRRYHRMGLVRSGTRNSRRNTPGERGGRGDAVSRRPRRQPRSRTRKRRPLPTTSQRRSKQRRPTAREGDAPDRTGKQTDAILPVFGLPRFDPSSAKRSTMTSESPVPHPRIVRPTLRATLLETYQRFRGLYNPINSANVRMFGAISTQRV